jgi:hypothetical protein
MSHVVPCDPPAAVDADLPRPTRSEFMSIKRILIGCTLLVATVACDGATAPDANQLGLSFAGAQPAGLAAGAAGLMANAVGDSLSITDGTNTLVITRVEVVAREIELRRAGIASCDSSASTDDCEYFSTSARLVTIPLAPGATQMLSVDAPAGTYSSVRVKVHKVSDDPGDLAFLAANPTWPEDQSIRVSGFYNGVAFTFLSDVNFDAEEDLQPAIVVDGATPTNLTVRLDLARWFRNGSTGPLIDPATAGDGGGNKSLVENNIKDSVEAFEDDDRDGDERDG